jgi:SulP family sulfate permease
VTQVNDERGAPTDQRAVAVAEPAPSAASRPGRALNVQLWPALRGLPGGALPSEVLAGVTLAALMIPLNIGYAEVASLPPVAGLYAAIVPLVAFGLFSSSRHVIAGPDAPIAALIGSILITFAVPGDARYVQLAYAQALVCAAILFAFWFFRLSFLANYLSRAVLIGFISGLGIEVFTSQLKKIMGVHIEAEGYFREVLALIAAIPRANLYCVAIGVGTIVVIRVLKRYAPRLPGALIALIFATVLVAALGLDQQGVSVLGPVPSGLPGLALPAVSLGDYAALFPGALAIAGVTIAEGLLLARRYAQKYGEQMDSDQILFAFAAANAAAGLTGSMVVGTSASRTAAMDSAGSRSQVPSLVGAAVVAIVLLFFSGLLALLPHAALGGIVANAVLSLIEVGELRSLYRLRRDEFWIAATCLVCVLVFGALQAVIIAFLLTTIDVVRRVANPQTGVLTPLPDGRGYVTSTGPYMAVTQPGLILYRFSGPLYFANANVFHEQAEALATGHGDGKESDRGQVEWFILDAEAINDIDTTGAEALEQTIEDLDKHGVTFGVARAGEPVRELLRRYGLMDKIGDGHIFETNRDAVAAFHQATGRPLPSAPQAGVDDS